MASPTGNTLQKFTSTSEGVSYLKEHEVVGFYSPLTVQ